MNDNLAIEAFPEKPRWCAIEQVASVKHIGAVLYSNTKNLPFYLFNDGP